MLPDPIEILRESIQESPERNYSRREVVSGLGSLITVGTAGCFGDSYEPTMPEDITPTDTPTESPSPTASPTPTPDYSIASTGVQEEAVEKAYTEYNEHFDNLEQFLEDDDLDEEFKDLQLDFWLNAEEYVKEEVARQWQEGIIRGLEEDGGNGFYMDDWTKNGIPHIIPTEDGWKTYQDAAYSEELPDKVLEHFNPFELPGAPDKWMWNFYNSNGQIYNPGTQEFLGFQPNIDGQKLMSEDSEEVEWMGDRVGLKGEKDYRPNQDETTPGKGSITDHPRVEITPEELNPREMHTFMWLDFLGDTKPKPEFGEAMSLIFDEKIPEDIFNEIVGENIPSRVNWHQLKHRQLPWNEKNKKTTILEAMQHMEEAIPEPLKGPVNYTIFVAGIEGEDASGYSLGSQFGDGGIVVYSPLEVKTGNASRAFEEVYAHAVGEFTNSEAGAESLTSMNGGNKVFDLLDKEWRQLLHNISAMNRDQDTKIYPRSVRDIENFYEPPRTEKVH